MMNSAAYFPSNMQTVAGLRRSPLEPAVARCAMTIAAELGWNESAQVSR